MNTLDKATFPGPDLQESDHIRLRGQIKDIFELMKDGKWRALIHTAKLYA